MTNKQLKQAIRDKYAWPGGYELFGITSDGAVLCCDCMRVGIYQILASRKHKLDDGWRVVAIDHTGNTDESVICDHCGKVIKEGET